MILHSLVSEVQSDGTNGESFPRAETDELRQRASAHGSSDETTQELVAAIFEHFAKPPPPPPADIKPRVSNWWIRAAVGAVITAASGFTAYQITEARSVSNQKAIQAHEDLPIHPAAGEEVRLIQVDIGKIKTEVDKIDAVAAGVESLKKEAQTDKQTRLEEKVKSLERENRRLARDQ